MVTGTLRCLGLLFRGVVSLRQCSFCRIIINVTADLCCHSLIALARTRVPHALHASALYSWHLDGPLVADRRAAAELHGRRTWHGSLVACGRRGAGVVGRAHAATAALMCSNASR